MNFQTDSVLRIVAQYYDRHGTPNERLKAHYLLGCAYRDLHEAPLALLAWEDAVASADTLSPDCDFATLYRVYGQMSDVYFRQYMPEELLEADNLYCKFALLAGDTLNYIRGLLQRNDAFLALKDTAAIYQNIEHVRHLFLERGMTKEAAQVYPMAIRIAVEKGQYHRADSLMHTFEQESGLFDKEGNIAPTREIYFYRKGLYYIGIHELDSAEFQFRKLLTCNTVLTDAYRGLLILFQQRHNTDSIFKYARLYEKALEHYLAETHTQAIIQAESLYDYHRQQNVAQEQEARARHWKLILTIGTLISLVFIAVIFMNYINERRKKKEKERMLIHLKENYHLAVENLTVTRNEATLLRKALTDEGKKQELALRQLEENKNEQIKNWESIASELRSEIKWLQETGVRMVIKESEILEHLHEIASAHFTDVKSGKEMVPSRAATDDEWRQLMQMTHVCHPQFYLFLKGLKLSGLKQKVCLLSRYSFKNPEISRLTGAHVKSISNARAQLADRFGLESTGLLDDYLRGI